MAQTNAFPSPGERPQAARMVRRRARGPAPRASSGSKRTAWEVSPAAPWPGTRTRRYHGWYAPAIPPPAPALDVRRPEATSSWTAGGETFGISTQIYRDAEHPAGVRTLSRFRLEPFPTWRHETAVLRGRALALPRAGALPHDRPLASTAAPPRSTCGSGRCWRFAARTASRAKRPTGTPRSKCGARSPGSGPCAYLPRLYLRGVFAATRTDSRLVSRTSATPRRPSAATTPRRISGARSSGSGRCAPDAKAFALFSLDEVAADPEHFLDEERRDGARPSRGRRTPSSTRWPAAPRLPGRGGSPARRRCSPDSRGSRTGDARAMVAAPGLAQATGRCGRARPGPQLVCRAAARRADPQPLLAGEEGEPEYDAIDASLWFILAVDWFGRARRNPGTPSPLLGAVRSIIEAYRRARASASASAADGLLVGNAPGRALTWMDAVVDGTPVTPRSGTRRRGQRALARRAQVRGAARAPRRRSRARPRARVRGLARRAAVQRDLLVRRPGSISTTSSATAGRTPA